MQLKAILCRTSTKKQLCNAYYKITLTYYLNISVQVANLSDCRIELKKSNRNFFCWNWNALVLTVNGHIAAAS